MLYGQGVGPHVRPVLGRHHADERVGEDVDELERALARQRVEREIAEAALAQRVDRVIEREPAREPDAHAVLGDLLEIGGGRRPQLGAQVAAPARRHHHRLAQPVRLHQPGLQLLGAGEVQLHAHEPVVHRALEQARDGGRRHAEGDRDVLLAAALLVVELQALDHLAGLARGLRN